MKTIIRNAALQKTAFFMSTQEKIHLKKPRNQTRNQAF